MFVTNYRLPQIERPTEEILNEDDNEVLAAFEIIFNGYKKAQKRTRNMIKAYNELESITQKILKKYNKVNEMSSTDNDNKSFIEKNNIGIESSTPSVQDRRIKKIDHDYDETDEIEMIDLTTIFENERTVENKKRDVSPVFGEAKKRIVKKKESPQKELSKDETEQNFDTEIDRTSLTTSSKRCIVESQAGNEENTPPSGDKNLSSNDTSIHRDESKPTVKICLTKSIYNIEKSKKCNRQSMKQSTLVFQPIIAKTDLTSSGKQIAEKPDVTRQVANLFETDYRTTKNVDSIKEKSTEKNIRNFTKPSKIAHSVPDQTGCQTNRASGQTEKPEVDSSIINEIKVINEKSAKKWETSIVIPTASQINETARSLFDDEDPDNFPVSPDIMNTCLESSNLGVLPRSFLNDDHAGVKNIHEPIPSTSKLSQILPVVDSIDETFFGPAELIRPIIDDKTKIPFAGCSKISKVEKTCNTARNLKRKLSDETILDEKKELEALNDINWDTEISNDNWATSKRLLDNSFDVPPKIKRSPEYAQKGKVERNKAKRSKLRGWNCEQCEKYYGNMELSEEEVRKRMNACSRHRSKYNPRYYTPKGFWNPEFPETTDSSDFDEN